MDWSTSLSWLTSLKGRREGRDADTDGGDMGTAFGLDASMIAHDEPARDGPAGAQPTSQEPWERRIVRRSAL